MGIVTCKVEPCKYCYEGMCGSPHVSIGPNGVCGRLVNRDGSPRPPQEWASDTKEKDFEIEYPEWHEIEEEEA